MARDNSQKEIFMDAVPQDGDVLEFNEALDKFVPRAPAESSSAGFTFHAFDFADFKTGNEAETNIDLLVKALAPGEYLEELAVHIVDEWNNPGDDVSLQLKVGGADVYASTKIITGGSDFYTNPTQARIDTISTGRVTETSRDIHVNINVAEFGAHTLNELSTGSLVVFVKTSQLPTS